VFTVGRMSCAAGAAETAAREAQKDVVARLDACDASSHLLNYAGSLMSQDERQLGRDDCVTAGHIGMAYAARIDLDPRFIWPNFIKL